MRAAWRLAISSLSARRNRAALLVAAVTLSAALISAVACAIASANGAIKRQLETQLGSAELRITPGGGPAAAAAGGGPALTEAVLGEVRGWPEVEAALPLARAPVSLRAEHAVLRPAEGGAFRRETVGFAATGFGNGADLSFEFDRRPVGLIAGRFPERLGEVLVDAKMAERLGFLYNETRRAGGRLGTPGLETGYLERPPPEMPEELMGPEAASRAAALNARVGVRPGDRVEVVRFLDLPVPPEVLAEIGNERVGPLLSRWLGVDARLTAGSIERAVRAFQPSVALTVVGIAESPPLGGQAQAWMSIETLRIATGRPAAAGSGELSEIAVELRERADPDAVVAAYEATLPEGVLLQTTERVTSSLDKNLASNQLGFILASVLAFMSAAFIIMTGLTTGLAEQKRALAVVRCIGGTKTQLSVSQLWTGLIVGGLGSLIGTPLGVAIAWGLIKLSGDRLPTGLKIPAGMLLLAAAGAVIAGLIGAAFPAWQVSRMSPLRGLSNRAEPTRAAHLRRTLAFALLGIVVQAVVVGLSPNKDTLFWGYASVGLPAMFVGYFLLSVPVTLLVVRLLGGPLTSLFRLPPRVLARTIEATPFRHGFTAGAMMAGLALMIAIWTNGGAVMRDWLAKIEFPDAFVNGLSIRPEAQDRIDAMPFVESTCAIAMHPVEVDAFGVSALQRYATTFVAFEPAAFFGMTNVEFVEGLGATNEERVAEAARRLEAGGAVIVGREFRAAQGLGVGDTFRCWDSGTEHAFEIVGVVTSPGLELASKFFNIGEEYIDQSIHAVFGSRSDMQRRFGSDRTQLIQVKFDEDALRVAAADAPELGDDAGPAERAEWAVAEIQNSLLGYGIMDGGSGVGIKSRIGLFIGGSLFVFSGVAVASMIVACFGVANLIVASIESRRYEFGVLRAVGAQPTLLLRLVLAEAVVIGVTAAVVGTLMGIQGSWAGVRIYQMLLGLSLSLKPPPTPIVLGWLTVLVFTVGAAAPAIIRLNSARTRELLAATKG